MTTNYSNLTGPHTIPKTGGVVHGAASMTTQVFGAGGLRSMLDQAHLNGLKEGFDEGFQHGFEAGLREKVFKLVDEALAQKTSNLEDALG